MPTYQYRCEKCGKRFERTKTIPPPSPPPKGRVEADYNKANQDTRITSFPDVLGTELRGAAVARTLKPSCVELLAYQIEDKAMAIWSLCGRHAGHLSMSAFRSEPDPTRRSRPCIHKSSCRNFAPE